MFCRNCGAELNENADFCVKCGASKGKGENFCQNCGSPTNSNQAVCIKCGVKLDSNRSFMQTSPLKVSTGNKFVRVKNGKILGGVFSGIEKCYGMNRWIGRAIAVLIPFWPIWLIAYIVICTQTEMVEE
ncbi:MAG: zinc-ribbon domain-containing protein [Clostridia bacterium]|nr:zinc-ribbon domain-containing protein [Clostridia bacterium]